MAVPAEKELSRRKDLERFRRLKEQNAGYVGFRGANAAPLEPPPILETVVCSVCARKRNVPSDTLPDDRSSFVCLRCQEAQEPVTMDVAE